MKIAADLVFWTAVYGGILGLLTILLAGNVSRLRMKHKAPWGDKGNHELIGAIRAHGNAAEFIPLFLVLFLVWELQGTSDNMLALVGGLFVAARLAHAYGMIAVHRMARQYSAGVSYLIPLLLALAVVINAL
jgi:uncharacterized membrane protein YecN with MAPEG domain